MTDPGDKDLEHDDDLDAWMEAEIAALEEDDDDDGIDLWADEDDQDDEGDAEP